MKKILYLLLAVCAAVLVLPCSAMAAAGGGKVAAPRDAAVATPGDASAATGEFTVSGGMPDTDFRYADHVLHILTGTPLTISGTANQDRIFVESGVNADITLTNFHSQLQDADRGPALQIAAGSEGKVKITLADGSAEIAGTASVIPKGVTLIVSSGARLTVSGGTTLTLAGGASLSVAENAVLTVAENATLTIAEGASLTASKGAALMLNGKVRVDGALQGGEPLSGADIRYRLTVKDADIAGETDGGYVRAGEKITLTPKKPAEGYIFAGWECTPADLKQAIAGNSFSMPASPVSVEARYEKKEYTVSFDLNGGSIKQAAGGTIAAQKVLHGDKAVCPEEILTPPAGKCRLDGWYTDGNQRWDFSNEVKESLKLTAHWAEHGAETKWIGSADGHEEQYVCCGTVKTQKTAHTWTSSGTCSVCAYACKHGSTVLKNRRPASCTSDGYTGDEICCVCGAVVKAGSRTARWGHSYGGWEYDRSGHWRECDECGERGRYAAHTYTSWTDAAGWRYDRCVSCGYQVMSAAGSSQVPGSTVPTWPGGSSASGTVPGPLGGSSSGTVPGPFGGASAGTGSGPAAGPFGNGTGNVQGQPAGSQNVVTGVAPGGQPGSGAGSASGTGSGSAPAHKPGEGSGSAAGAGSAAESKPGSTGATSAGSSAGTGQSGSFWAQSGSGGNKAEGTGAGTVGTRPAQKPSEEEKLNETTEAGTLSDDAPVIVTMPSAEDYPEESGQTDASSEAGEVSAQAGSGSGAGIIGEVVFERIPLWFWVAAFVGIAAAIVVFAVMSMREEERYYDENESI